MKPVCETISNIKVVHFNAPAPGFNNVPGMVSDAFNGPLNGSIWSFYDPIGNSSVSRTENQVAISVPAGSNHDLWTNALFAPRIMQAANNTNFEIEAKFDSPLLARYQLHGFIVEQNETNFVDFMFYTDGSATRVFSASFVDGIPTIRINSVVENGSPMYLRVTRFGKQWTVAYSYDGRKWTIAGNYSHTLSVNKVGIFGGNSPDDSPAYTALIDYFMVNGIAPGNSVDTDPPVISGVQASTTDTRATITWSTDEPADSRVNYGLTPEMNSTEHGLKLTVAHSATLDHLTPDTEYRFQVESIDGSGNSASSREGVLTTKNALGAIHDLTPPVISNIHASATNTTATITWTTDEPANAWVSHDLAVKSPKAASNRRLLSPNGFSLLNLAFESYQPDSAGLADRYADVSGRFDHALRIDWLTEDLANSWLNEESGSGADPYGKNHNFTTVHSATLKNLIPGTEYAFRVQSRDRRGNLTTSLNRNFKTTIDQSQRNMVNWQHLSSSAGDLPVPPVSRGQSGLKVVDLNKDGRQDYFMSFWQNKDGRKDYLMRFLEENSPEETMVWYQQQPNGTFVKYLIDNEKINISHSERFQDIDGDGDIDLMIGQASSGNTIDWWENPYPNYLSDVPWVRREIYSGKSFYHDGIWGDFDGDGADEYMSWNQKSQTLLLFEKPEKPKTSGPWPVTRVFSWPGEGEYHRYKGADAIDVDLDGKLDFVGACGWFEHQADDNRFIPHIIDESQAYSQVVAGQLITGGRPEIVCLKELEPGPLNMYQWNGSHWQVKTLIAKVSNAHTLQLGDLNKDGYLDIMFAEMAQWNSPIPNYPNAGLYVLYGDGSGNFNLQTIHQGQGHLEGQLADIDSDGDLDIVTKPFRHNIPLIEIWKNQGNF